MAPIKAQIKHGIITVILVLKYPLIKYSKPNTTTIIVISGNNSFFIILNIPEYSKFIDFFNALNDINTDNEEVIEDLYEDYLSYFFTPSNIYNYLSFLSAKEKEDGDIKIYNYEYVYDDKDITFDITTTVNRIQEIVITYDNHIYNIKFSL